jgi:opacity protein-like surface antigen
MGIAGRSFVAGWTTLCICMGSVQAQEDAPASPSFSAPHGISLPGARSYFGINLGRALIDTNCPATVLFCESRDRSSQLFAGRMFSPHWGAEVGYVDTGRVQRGFGEVRSSGLSLSLVGRAQLLPSLGVYGKVGTTYARPDTAVMGNSAAPGGESGFGIAYGGGVSWDFSSRFSATLEVDSQDLKLGSGPVRSGTLGLQYRY